MTQQTKCPICKSEEFTSHSTHSSKDAVNVECRICGKYVADREFLLDSGSGLDERIRYLLSAIVREANEAGSSTIEVSYQSYQTLIAGRELFDVSSKAIKFLRLINSRTRYYGDQVKIRMEYDYPLAFAKNQHEFNALRDYLIEAGNIKGQFPGGDGNLLSITTKGIEFLEQSATKGKDGNQAFVAMWFDSSLLPIFENGIDPAVRACGYSAVRVDRLEHNQKIDDLIISSINDSKFLVADFTGHRQSVYFEAGYALGQKKQVIWICKDSDINASHFDTRQYNHIVWTSESDLKAKLENRIAAVIGRNRGN